MTANDIHLDDQLASLFPQPTESQLTHLRESIRAEGLRDALLVWKTGGRRVLVDGYTRLTLARELGLDVRCTEIRLADRNAAIAYRVVTHLERRNLSMLAQAVLRGRLHLLVGGRQGERTDLPGHEAGATLTAAGIAARFAVSERTIRRDRRVAEAVDLLGSPEQQGPQFAALLMAGRTNLTRRGILQLARMGRVEQQRLLARLEREREDRQTRPRRKPPAPSRPTTPDRNSGADTPAVRQEAASPKPLPVTQMPALTPLPNGPSPDTKHAVEAACRLANPTPAGLTVDTEPADEGVLEKLTAIWRKANHATRISFLRQPAVQIAVQRLNSSEVRK